MMRVVSSSFPSNTWHYSSVPTASNTSTQEFITVHDLTLLSTHVADCSSEHVQKSVAKI